MFTINTVAVDTLRMYGVAGLAEVASLVTVPALQVITTIGKSKPQSISNLKDLDACKGGSNAVGETL